MAVSEAIRLNHVVVHLQPIASARRQGVLGLEALARFASPEQTTAASLFQGAARESVTEKLERHCCEVALRTFAQLPMPFDRLVLFLNLGSWLITSPESGFRDLRQFARSAGLAPRNVAVEFLEASVDDRDLFAWLVKRLRAFGFLIVLDDVGKGHSNLDRIALIKPDILKIDRSLISKVDRNFHKQATLKSLVGLGRRIGAATVAEGVETREEALVALELGVDMLQGYFISNPQPQSAVDLGVSQASRVVASLGRQLRDLMVKKIHRDRVQHRLLVAIANDIMSRLSAQPAADFDHLLEEVVLVHPNIECVYLLDASGQQVTTAMLGANATRRTQSVVFQPARVGTDHSLQEYFYALSEAALHTFTTESQMSLASGNVCRTFSTMFRHLGGDERYVLCLEVAPQAAAYRAVQED